MRRPVQTQNTSKVQFPLR